MIERFEAISKVTRTIELSSMVSRKLAEVSTVSFVFIVTSQVTRSTILISPLGIEEL